MKKFFRKNQTALLILALVILFLMIFIPARMKDARRQSTQENPVTAETSVATAIAPDTRAEAEVPILMYHHIRVYNDQSDKIGTNLSVSPENFIAQIKYLKDNGYSTITFSDLLAFPTKKLADKPVIITFDDGYSDAFTNAYSALKQNGQVGVFYIISGFLGRPDFLTADQVKQMSDGNMEIGSHTINHPDLTTLNQIKLINELAGSKSSLEAVTGKTINSFCYPSGQHNTTVDETVKQAGYLTATTTEPGVSTTTENKYALSRLRINPTDTLNTFIKKLTGK
ncbi:MAG: polysaccharide deacetylase family protein [Candidatus Berkelbacteria bacterium]